MVVMVSVADTETPKDVLVRHISAESVSHSPSGPDGLGGNVGIRSGPMVYEGQVGSGPLVSTVMPINGGKEIGGGGPGG